MTYTLEQLLAMVIVVSFLGFCLENVWILFRHGFIDNRNMRLPFLTGYGLTVLGFYELADIPTEENQREYFAFAFLIVSAGENVYPTQVEEAINEFDRVADCMVTSVPDAARGQAIAAYIVPKDPELTIKDVFDFCLETPMLSAYKRPRWYKFVDSLPMTATGKKMHYVLKQQAAKDLEAGELKRK